MSKKREPRVLMIADRARAMRRRKARQIGSEAESSTRRRIDDGRFDATQGARTAGLLIDQLLEEIGGEG
jgi:hypothetical protein